MGAVFAGVKMCVCFIFGISFIMRFSQQLSKGMSDFKSVWTEREGQSMRIYLDIWEQWGNARGRVGCGRNSRCDHVGGGRFLFKSIYTFGI